MRSSRKITRRAGGGFSPRRLVASRRQGRRRAMLAALPAAPAAPLSQKSRCAAIFGSPVCFSGHAIIKRAPPSPFLQKPYGKLGALAQKRGFACAECFISRVPRREILTISFELTKEIVERKGEPCRSPSFDGSAAVSPLCAAHCRAHHL